MDIAGEKEKVEGEITQVQEFIRRAEEQLRAARDRLAFLAGQLDLLNRMQGEGAPEDGAAPKGPGGSGRDGAES